MQADKTWRPAPNTRESIRVIADQIQRANTGLDGSVGRILDRQYHDRTAYAAVRQYMREMRDLFERLDFHLMIQQGLEHREFTDIVLSGILRAGDALHALDLLSEIEHNDAVRELERKARKDES